MSRHPVEAAIASMGSKDRDIAEKLREAGFSDEDLYAALPNPGADKLLSQPMPPSKPAKVKTP